MKKVSFEEMGVLVVTMLAGTGVEAGMVVAMDGNGAVGPCGAGVRPCGVALTAGIGGTAAVQVKGTAQVHWSGTALTAGWGKLTGDGTGGLKTAGTGQEAGEILVLETDDGDKTAVVLL